MRLAGGVQLAVGQLGLMIPDRYSLGVFLNLLFEEAMQHPVFRERSIRGVEATGDEVVFRWGQKGSFGNVGFPPVEKGRGQVFKPMNKVVERIVRRSVAGHN